MQLDVHPEPRIREAFVWIMHHLYAKEVVHKNSYPSLPYTSGQVSKTQVPIQQEMSVHYDSANDKSGWKLTNSFLNLLKTAPSKKVIKLFRAH